MLFCVARDMTNRSDRQPEQEDELQVEAEGLKCTFERIEFLAKQGIISESDAARKKQDVIDSFCLAPMLERRRRVLQQHHRHQREQQQQQDYDRAGVLLGGGARSAFTVGVESECPLSLPPSPSAGGGASPLPVPPAPPVVNTTQSVLPRLPAEVSQGHACDLSVVLLVEGLQLISGLLRGPHKYKLRCVVCRSS